MTALFTASAALFLWGLLWLIGLRWAERDHQRRGVVDEPNMFPGAQALALITTIFGVILAASTATIWVLRGQP